MKTIVIIQARMGSTRLPGKVLLPLGESTVLNYVVSRCRKVKKVSEVIVATSTLSSDNPIAEWCHDHDVMCFRGSEEDVLSRYYECASPYNPDYVIRVTSDCPFVDFKLANQAVELMHHKPADIFLLEGDLPRGLAIEMISFSALKHIHRTSTALRHREHVTYFAYEYPERFETNVLHVPEQLRHPELRLTLDMPEDYQLCLVVNERMTGWPFVASEEIVNYLLKHPEVAQINAHIEQKQVL